MDVRLLILAAEWLRISGFADRVVLCALGVLSGFLDQSWESTAGRRGAEDCSAGNTLILHYPLPTLLDTARSGCRLTLSPSTTHSKSIPPA